MSKIRLHGSSSGYTEIAPVAASGNNTLTLPNDGTIISNATTSCVARECHGFKFPCIRSTDCISSSNLSVRRIWFIDVYSVSASLICFYPKRQSGRLR